MADGQHPSLVPRWTVAVHAVQILFAIIILGFDAYGIKYIAYNALIFSLVVCLCTMAVGAYMIVSQTILPKMYNVYVALAVHVWLLIFWLVDLGLVANLAAMWGRGDYCFTTSYGFGSTYCYTKRDLIKRDYTTFGAYYGVLTAGAIFAAIQLVTWALTGVLLVLAWNKNRTAGTSANPNVPPQYQNNGQAVPMEKYDQPAAPTPGQQYGTPQPQFASPQPQYAQPAQPQFTGAPYAQDPVQRQDTVSPVSHAGGYAHNPSVSGVSSPQHTGQPAYPPTPQQQAYPQNAAEVHTDPYNPNVPELSNHR
ncbi:uncharacterized protein CC84DRAFT_1161604 [Paraphaeosphaeria sporulosa]|uniref:MARVEL domain-containing protein n=1 Tax=Paraphaeosphaeria sporulosa TaxID=1460663 RepID=A0A177CT80_9PLEO|nr:uncharacterized protein CC84DRAFT_1161604 [Paraphaeosphaeria sporulosa]OAG10744.1 hypothetical protein CC84DRAFT_1161604 [Paraphaeosphaeria sporulosa]